MAAQLAEGGPSWTRPYRSAHGLAVLATIALSLTIVYEALLAFVFANARMFVALGLGKAFDTVNSVIVVLLAVAGGISFLFWFARSYRNLPSLGAESLERSPRSAVLWWFAPLFSLVVPLLITAEIWKASDPATSANTAETRRRMRFPRLLMAWWIAWWGSKILGRIAVSANPRGLFGVSVLLDIVAAALAISVIWRIQLRQDERAGPRADQGSALFPGPAAPDAATRRSGNRVLIVVVGLGGLGLAALVAVAAFAIIGFMHAAAECPPKDFPVYAGAEPTDFNYDFSPGSSDCTAGWEANASPDTVMAFYESSFTSGAWQLDNQDAQSGVWYFERSDDPGTVGRIRFLGHGTQTRVEMEIMTGQSPSSSSSP